MDLFNLWGATMRRPNLLKVRRIQEETRLQGGSAEFSLKSTQEPTLVYDIEVILKNVRHTEDCQLSFSLSPRFRGEDPNSLDQATFDYPFPNLLTDVGFPLWSTLRHQALSFFNPEMVRLRIHASDNTAEGDATVVFRMKFITLTELPSFSRVQVIPLSRFYRIRFSSQGSEFIESRDIVGAFSTMVNTRFVCDACGSMLGQRPMWQLILPVEERARMSQSSYDLCEECFSEGRYPPGHGDQDFRLIVFRDEYESMWDGPFHEVETDSESESESESESGSDCF